MESDKPSQKPFVGHGESKLLKESKGAVDKLAPVRSTGNNHHDGKDVVEDQKAHERLSTSTNEELVRGLPHQRVPQPTDLNTQALEQL